MKMTSLTTGILILALLAGCRAGPMIHELDQAKSPFGANIEIRVSQTDTAKTRMHEGELIEAREDGLVVALNAEEDEPSRITFVPWQRIHSVKATDLPGFRVRGERNQSPSSMPAEEIRLISRFPQGLSPDLIQKLLASFDQTTIDPLP